MNYEEFPAMVTLALSIVAVMGVAVASLLEFVKQVLKTVFNCELAGPFMAVVSGTLSAALVVYLMVQMQVPWPIAVLAALTALFSPKAAHDAMGKLKY